MFRGSISNLKMFALAAVLLAYPCGMAAQRGGAGGHVGGGLAGSGGLSGGGRSTGVDEKDDLKDFHAALAVQATSQQIIEFNAMVQSTERAGAELRAFLDHAQRGTAELARYDKVLADALEIARGENKKFLGTFSDRQKSGLKEAVKKLIKADSDLAQRAKMLDLEVEVAKTGGPQITGSAQSLEGVLIAFRDRQIDLGEEMSIAPSSGSPELTYNLPAVRNSVSFEQQPVAITTSAIISRSQSKSDQNTFSLELTADMSDLQLNITEVLRAELNKSDSCGEQIAIRRAILTPSAPASLAQVQVHYERWACFGRGTAKEMVEGNGTIDLKLSPAVGDDGTLRLLPAVARVDAEGVVGELLRSGSLGEALRDKVAESVLSTMRQGTDYKNILPSAAQGNVTMHRAQFQGTGAGKLSFVVLGDIRLSSDKVASLTVELKAGEAKGQPSSTETAPR